MNFVLSGYKGFLGRIIQNVLTQKQFKIIDINDFSKERIDITKPFELHDFSNVDVFIHAAGKAHSIPKTEEESKVFFDVNYEGTKRICEAIDKTGIVLKGFVFISTVSVYGLDEGINIKEDFPLKADSPYGKSKIMAEEFLKNWGEINNVPILILRLPLIAGPCPPGNLGKMIAGINSGKYFSVNKGKAKRSVVMAEDVANCIVNNVGKSGIYNLTDGFHPSFREIEETISRQLHKKTPKSLPLFVSNLLGKVGDLFSFFPVNSKTISKMSVDLTFNDSKARKDLNWNPSKIIDVFTIK